jgi:hypothetical protein
MSTESYGIIREEFDEAVNSIRQLIEIADGASPSPKVRLAAANSCTLLLAATFEEFVREMAREYARFIVRRAKEIDKVPVKLITTAWKRSIGNLARIDKENESGSPRAVMVDTRSKFAIIYGFVSGDINQDIYGDLIHNDKNMRADQINELFNVSNLSNICKKIAGNADILVFLGEDSANSAEGKFRKKMDDFIDRRNGIAHELNIKHSDGASQIRRDIEFLQCVARAMEAILKGYADCAH